MTEKGRKQMLVIGRNRPGRASDVAPISNKSNGDFASAIGHITVKREFAAGRQRVWDCHTKRELLDQWFAPRPLTTRTKHMEFKEGGYWHYAMTTPDGESFWNRLDYQAINPIDGYVALYNSPADVQKAIEMRLRDGLTAPLERRDELLLTIVPPEARATSSRSSVIQTEPKNLAKACATASGCSSG
ncbi:SRPBCC family protein [Pandoraea soli]